MGPVVAAKGSCVNTCVVGDLIFFAYHTIETLNGCSSAMVYSSRSALIFLEIAVFLIFVFAIIAAAFLVFSLNINFTFTWIITRLGQNIRILQTSH